MNSDISLIFLSEEPDRGIRLGAVLGWLAGRTGKSFDELGKHLGIISIEDHKGCLLVEWIPSYFSLCRRIDLITRAWEAVGEHHVESIN